jgi:hypothetical protein
MNFEQPEFYLGYDIAFQYNFCATGWFGIPAGARDFSVLQNVNWFLDPPTQPPTKWIPGALSPSSKVARQ